MGGIISGITGSAKKARRAQVRATEDANRLLAQAKSESQDRLQPFINYGNQSNNALNMRLGNGNDTSNPLYGSLLKTYDGNELLNSPGYQFGMDQGMRALSHSQAAKGGLFSGAAMKEATRFGQDYAGTKFQEGYNRDNTDKNRIAGFLGTVANMGYNASNAANSNSFNTANAVGNNILGAGNAIAASHIAQGNIWDNVLNQGIQAGGAAIAGGMGGGGFSGALKGAAGNLSGSSNGIGGLLDANFLREYLSKK